MRVVIAGAGIGGLSLALMLHESGIKTIVFEKAKELSELGVGINLLPHAVGELFQLGLDERLDDIGIRTRQLLYKTASGQNILAQKRGLWAGLPYPQYSIHRGRLHSMLLQTFKERVGADCLVIDRALESFQQDKHEVIAKFQNHAGVTYEQAGDILVGSDGIHSVAREYFYPDQGPPIWNGVLMWRGATWSPKFLGGDSMIIAGGMDRKLVIYPIAEDPNRPDEVLTNWVVNVKLADFGTKPPSRHDWSRQASVEDVLSHANKNLSVAEVDINHLIRNAPGIFEYPMCDRDGLPAWSHGRVTLLGDAAHPMYPVGSNGASQAIIDARCLSDELIRHNDPVAALAAYDKERRPLTSDIVQMNRSGGPERVIDLVQARAPNGFEDIHDVVSDEDLSQIVGDYQKLTGMKG